MEVTLSAMPSYLPSLAWVGTCLWHMANEKCQTFAMKTREYTRTLIESNSPEGMVLTVPLVGGSSAAKRLKPAQLEISSHGDWTRIHLGAIEAAYGREPYFQHYFPGISVIIADYPPMLEEMNRRLLINIFDSIRLGENLNEINGMRIANPERIADIRRRLMSKVNPRHSIIEPLFRLGPDSVFLF